MRSPMSILIDTVRTQSLMAESYFAAKAGGADEASLRQIEAQVLSAAATGRGIASEAETIEAASLRAFETHLAALRDRPEPDHPESPEPASRH